MPPPDDPVFQAARAAVLELARDYAPLSRLECILVACVAVARAHRTLAEPLPPSEACAILTEHARLALRAARAGTMPRARLVGGIERLPQPQRLALALRYSEGLSDAECAAVLGCSEAQVRELTTAALAKLIAQV